MKTYNIKPSKLIAVFILYIVVQNVSVLNIFGQNPHINAIKHVRISPTGKYAISTSDNILCIWSLTEKKLLHTLQEYTVDVAFITDETFYKVEYQNKKCIVSLYNTVSGKKEKTVFEKENILNVVLSPKGNFLAGRLNGTHLYVVNLKTNQEIEKFTTYPSMATSTNLLFTYDEKYLYQVSNLKVFSRYIVETGKKDWEVIKEFNDKLMIKTIAHIQNKCLIAGDFTITFDDNQAKNFYFFGENKYEIYSWRDTKYTPYKCITNPVTQNEVIMACSNNEVVFTSGVSNDITLQKPKIKTKNFLRDIDISQNGQFLIVSSSSGYVQTKPGEKGYAKIEIYDWIDKKKIIEF